MPWGYARGGSAGSGRRGAVARSQRPRRVVRHRGDVLARTYVPRGETIGVSWFGGFTFYIDVAYASGPYDAAFDWESIAADVQAITSRIGRQDEFSDYSPGLVTVQLGNTRVDSRDPTATARPYNPNDQYMLGLRSATAVLPGSPLRVRVSIGTSTLYPLGWGTIQGWPFTEDLTTSVQDVTLTAVDAFSALARAELSESAYAAEVLRDSPLVYYSAQRTTDTPGFIEDLCGRADVVVPDTVEVVDTAAVPLSASASVIPVYSPTITGTVPTGSAAPLTCEVWVTRTRTAEAQPNTMWFRYVVDATNFLEIAIDYTANEVIVYWSNSVRNRCVLAASSNCLPALRIDETRTSHLVVTMRDPSAASRIYVDGQHVASPSISVGTLTRTDYLGQIVVQGGGVPAAGGAASVPTSSFSHLAFYDKIIRPVPLSGDYSPWRALPNLIQTHYVAGHTAWGTPMPESTGNRIWRILDDAGWPTVYRDFPSVAIINDVVDHGGQSVVTAPYSPAGGRALPMMQQANALEQGILHVDFGNKVRFRDRTWRWWNAAPGGPAFGGGNVQIFGIEPDYSTDQIRNLSAVSFDGGTRTARDEESVRRSGALDESVDASLSSSSYLALQLGRYRIRTHSATFSSTSRPIRIKSIQVDMRAVTALDRASILNLVIGQWVGITHQPVRGTYLDLQASVQGIEHEVRREGTWIVTLYLSAEGRDYYNRAPYLVMGDVTYGKIGATAGNLIPY